MRQIWASSSFYISSGVTALLDPFIEFGTSRGSLERPLMDAERRRNCKMADVKMDSKTSLNFSPRICHRRLLARRVFSPTFFLNPLPQIQREFNFVVIG